LIKGFSGTTLIDFPGKIASIIFIGGCNFRCPICHNPELVLPELLRELKDIDEEYIIKEIERRKGFIDGVVITGGEPLLYDETIELAKRIKENGLLVKLDTNGSFPERLKKIIPFVDYIAMDIKTSLERYNHAAGVSVEKV
jgi:pyruvate formate lyase activating enzyme